MNVPDYVEQWEVTHSLLCSFDLHLIIVADNANKLSMLYFFYTIYSE